MGRLVLTQITIKKERSISSTTWYYLLQPADASAPDSTNYGNPPPTYSDTGYSGWSTTEPTYTVGDNRVLYVMVQTLYSDGTFSYSTPTISSSYKAAKDAYNEVVQAEATIGEFEELGLKRGYVWDNMTYVAPSGSIPAYPIGTYVASGMLVNGQRSITHSNSNTYGLNTWISTGGINLRYNAIDLMKLTTSNLEFYYPSTSSQQKKAISLGTNGLVNSLAFYGFNSDNKTMELTNSGLSFYNPSDGSTELASFTSDGLVLSKGGVIAGRPNQSGFIYLSTEPYGSYSVNGSSGISDWKEIIGTKFGVTSDGTLYTNGANITNINADNITSGSISTNILNIGGTNLFGYGSDCQTSLNGLNNTGFSITTEDGAKCAHATGALTTTKYISSKLTYTPRPMETFTYSVFVKIKNIVRGTTNPMCEFYFAGTTIDGTWRGFSVEAIYVDGVKVSTTNIGFDKYITDTKWHHVAVTAHFNYNGTSTIPDIRPAIYLRDCTGDLYFHHVKLERGNKATDWSFAPDDSAYITKITDNGIYISPSSQRPISGSEGNSVKIDGEGMEVFKGGISVAKYSNMITIGVTNGTQSYMVLDYHSLQMIDKEGDYYLYISDRRGENGSATLEANFLGDGETIQFDVGVNMNTLISAVDSSNPSNVGSINATTPRYLVFQNAPANGAQVTITFTTTDQGAKAYTLGTRDTTNDVLGASSVVLNRLNVASGPDSCASGYYTVASGNNAHSEGLHTTASGGQSHAEGYYTTASANNSHAEGGTLQKANGTIIYTIASGYGSHAEGAGTIASKQSSHAEGTGTTASGHSSHSEGYYTTASASNAHAEGGPLNTDGAGTYTYTTASGVCSHAEGSGTTASGGNSHAEGTGTTASGHSSHAEGGTLNDNGTIIYTIASGAGSHAEGLGTTASRQSAHAEGGKTKAIALSAHAEGNATTASGQSAHAEGMLSVASGSESHAEGYETTASGKFAHSQNLDTIAQRKSQTAIGEYNVADTSGADGTVRGAYALIIGNGTANNARSNALTVDWDGDITIKNHSSPIGTMLSYTSDEISCATGKYYQLAYLTLDAGVWMIDYVGQFPNTNTTGIRDTFVTTDTSGYNNVTTSPGAYGVVTRDRRKGEAHIIYCKSSFPVNITSTTTFRLIGYQNSGQTNSVLGRMYAVRIA